jgi:hypothetical protein
MAMAERGQDQGRYVGGQYQRILRCQHFFDDVYLGTTRQFGRILRLWWWNSSAGDYGTTSNDHSSSYDYSTADYDTTTNDNASTDNDTTTNDNASTDNDTGAKRHHSPNRSHHLACQWSHGFRHDHHYSQC